MVPWILLLLPVPALAAVDKTHGVPLNLISKYVPLNGGASPTWKCLDGTREIAWSAVNDDFCDCPDGSDEPGTGACPDTFFVCRNEDHIPGRIPSSRVNDGLCEPECCDGSDERTGVCENTCKEVGAAYRMEQEAGRKLRKTGSKIRSSYITFAHKEKKRLEETIATSQKEINSRQQEVDRLRDVVDRTESLSAAALEEKKKSPLYQTLVKHHQALKSLQKEHKKHVEREKALGDILDALRSKYNPNYQDMAVLEAVRGWEYYAGLPHINDVRKNEEGSDEEDAGETAAEEEEELEEGMWTKEQLEKDLDSLLNSNFESLLLEHENHIGAPTKESVLFNLAAYLPDSLVPQYEQYRDGLLSWLETFGIVKGTHPSGATADTSHAKQALNEAEQTLRFAQQEKSKAEEDVNRLFDPKWFGLEGEWKKLDGTCLEKDTGEYIYEVCLFGEAKQKPKNSGSTFSLGHFTSWNNAEGIEIGSPEYYSKQYYTRGAKCWNGPQRSVVLVWTCGIENAIHSIQELEKCEYQLTGTSPALCLPLDAPAALGKREEL